MGKFHNIYLNLKNVLGSEIKSDALNFLKELINYDNNGFYNVSRLRTHIKDNSMSDDDEALFAISALFDIQLLIEKYEGEGQIPTRDIDNNPLTYEQLIENNNNSYRNHKISAAKYNNKILDKPLKWGKLVMSNYYMLDLDSLEITHEVKK